LFFSFVIKTFGAPANRQKKLLASGRSLLANPEKIKTPGLRRPHLGSVFATANLRWFNPSVTGRRGRVFIGLSVLVALGLVAVFMAATSTRGLKAEVMVHNEDFGIPGITKTYEARRTGFA
jgi:hypothetical protein